MLSMINECNKYKCKSITRKDMGKIKTQVYSYEELNDLSVYAQLMNCQNHKAVKVLQTHQNI